MAGGPLAADVLKCQLKPVDAGDYKVRFTSAELARLRRIFPAGVWRPDQARSWPDRCRALASFGPAPTNLVFDVTRPTR